MELVLAPSLLPQSNPRSVAQEGIGRIRFGVASMESRNFRWQVTGIGVGDPVYLLGNVVPRTAEDLAANGTHPTAQSALLTMTQSKDGVGNQSLFHLGTELTLLGGMRSTMESIIIPSIVLIFSIVMFVNYG